MNLSIKHDGVQQVFIDNVEVGCFRIRNERCYIQIFDREYFADNFYAVTLPSDDAAFGWLKAHITDKAVVLQIKPSPNYNILLDDQVIGNFKPYDRWLSLQMWPEYFGRGFGIQMPYESTHEQILDHVRRVI
jgi:hypothetical protein